MLGQEVKESSNSVVASAFEKLNFTSPLDQYSYVRKMETEFGREGYRFLDAVDSSISSGAYLDPDAMRRVYRLKNKDWRMSLVATLHQDAYKFRRFLEWLLSVSFQDEGLLVDIGCDSGVLTCLLAELYPKRQILGIDRVQEAIMNARILARNKKITNASFQVFGLGRPDSTPGFSATLAIAPFVFQEVFRNILSGGIPSDDEHRAARQVSDILASGGRLISVDRLPGGHDEARPMVDFIQRAGLELEARDILEVPGPLMVETFPVSIFRKA